MPSPHTAPHDGAWERDDTALAHLALRCLDLTELGDHCTAADVEALCAKAQGCLDGAPGRAPVLPAVAAVCVWPAFVAQARRTLPATIRVAAVVNFPSGDSDIDAVCAEVDRIRAEGGQEVDCVLPYRAWLAGERNRARALVRAVRQASQGLTLKLILESGAFPEDDALRAACDMALAEGVDFLKTSTGKIAQGASLRAAETLLTALAQHPNGGQRGFKPSGGLRTLADVRPYVQATAQHLGTAALTPQRFRIGASGLWSHIAQHLAGHLGGHLGDVPPKNAVPSGTPATY